MPLNNCLGDDAQEIKRKWYETNKVENRSSLIFQLLRSYRRFISYLPSEVLEFEEKIVLENKVLKKLSERKDLDLYDCESFGMALKFYIQLM